MNEVSEVLSLLYHHGDAELVNAITLKLGQRTEIKNGTLYHPDLNVIRAVGEIRKLGRREPTSVVVQITDETGQLKEVALSIHAKRAVVRERNVRCSFTAHPTRIEANPGHGGYVTFAGRQGKVSYDPLLRTPDHHCALAESLRRRQSVHVTVRGNRVLEAGEERMVEQTLIALAEYSQGELLEPGVGGGRARCAVAAG